MTKELEDISLDNLILLVGYYANSTKEKHETIKKFMHLFEKRLFQLMTFFNSQEILQILYGYIKLNTGSNELFNKLETRALSIIDTFTVQELEKLIALTSNSPRRLLIFDSIEQQLLKNIKVLKPYHFPNIFFTFALNNLGSELFYSIMNDKICSSIFLYTPEQISRLVWSYSVKMPWSDVFFLKAQEFIIENTEKFTINEIANIVWSFTEAKKGNNLLFIKLEEQIQKNSDKLTIKEVAKIFWGYVNKLALSKTTVENSFKIIKKNANEADAWDLAQILWGFSRFKTEEYDEIYKIMENRTKNLCEEMNNYEFVTALRAYSEKKLLEKDLLEVFLNKLDLCMHSLNEKEILVVVHCLVNGNVKGETKRIEGAVMKLWEKLKKIEGENEGGRKKEENKEPKEGNK